MKSVVLKVGIEVLGMDGRALLGNSSGCTYKGPTGPKGKVPGSHQASQWTGSAPIPVWPATSCGMQVNYWAHLRSGFPICKMQEDHSIYFMGCLRLDEVMHASWPKKGPLKTFLQ